MIGRIMFNWENREKKVKEPTDLPPTCMTCSIYQTHHGYLLSYVYWSRDIEIERDFLSLEIYLCIWWAVRSCLLELVPLTLRSLRASCSKTSTSRRSSKTEVCLSDGNLTFAWRRPDKQGHARPKKTRQIGALVYFMHSTLTLYSIFIFLQINKLNLIFFRCIGMNDCKNYKY